MYVFISNDRPVPASKFYPEKTGLLPVLNFAPCVIKDGRTRVLTDAGFVRGEVSALMSGLYSAWRVTGRFSECSGNVFTNPLDATAWVLA